VLNLIICFFNDIYTNYVMESLKIFFIKASLASLSRVPGFSSPWENPPYLTSTFRKLVLVVLNIYNTVHNYNIKKSGTIAGKAAILEPQIQTIIWVASGTQPQNGTRLFYARYFVNT